MPRLLGVEIPADKRIEASLTYIYGIGFSTARRILEQTNIDPNIRAKNLTPQQLNEIIHAITNNKIKIEPQKYGEPGLTKYGDLILDQRLTNTRRFYPHLHNTSGFFIAKIRVDSGE
jgi:ribosomal protein S13